MSLINQVRTFARRHDLWRPDTRVIAAVSGGSDSVALLFLLHELAARGEFVLDSVAHLNHLIRGDAALRDEAFCRDLAERLQLSFVSRRVDVPALAAESGQSVELAARNARQRFFLDALVERGSDRIATAHTRDDQAETVLLRLVRGAGLQGVGGIRPRRDHLIRPLLECQRDDLRAELVQRDEAWCEDESNLDYLHPRNRVRHELLPYLARHFNPSIAEALARVADLAQADDKWLAEEAAAHVATLVAAKGTTTEVDATGLVRLPEALARRVARTALETANPSRSYRLDEADLLRAVAAGEPLAAEIAGLRMEHFSGRVVLQKREVSAPSMAFCFELVIPGAVQQREAGWRLEAEGPRAVERPFTVDPSGQQVAVEAAGLGRALTVRNRRPGDRLRPVGLGGAKKLQDLFVDRKVRREERDRMPIVTDANDRIIWVPGHALAEEFRVTEGTNAVVVLKLRPIHPRGRESSPADGRKAERR